MFYIVFQVFKVPLWWDTASSSFISCFTPGFTSADIIFYNLLELHSTLSDKDFCHKFSFFNRFTQNSHSLHSQNLLNVTKVFRQFSLKCLLKCFKYLLTKCCKSSFMYQQLAATLHIFLKVPTTGFLDFFSEHISRTAYLTQASVITC